VTLNRICRGSLGGWFKRNQFDWLGCTEIIPGIFGNSFKTVLTVQKIEQRTFPGDDPAALLQTMSVDANSIVCFNENLQRLAVSAVFVAPSAGLALPVHGVHGARPVGGSVSFDRADTASSHPGWIDYNPFIAGGVDGLPENGGSGNTRAFSIARGTNAPSIGGPVDQSTGISYTMRASISVFDLDISAGDEPGGVLLHDTRPQLPLGADPTILGVLHWGLVWNESLLPNPNLGQEESYVQIDLTLSFLQV